VQTVKTDVLTIGSANNSPTAVSGMSASITPSSTSNKVLVQVSISYGSTGTTYAGWVRRDGTDIGIGNSANARQRVSLGMALCSDTNQMNTFTFSYLDSPSSTSALNYQFYVINDNNGALYVNRSVADGDAAVGKRGISTVTLMEIAG
jgi:hypothetical protein